MLGVLGEFKRSDRADSFLHELIGMSKKDDDLHVEV